jgi:dihydroflavonol-4-reductase
MTATYLVTGGTGFLGQHLVRQLLEEDKVQVRILSRSADRALERLGAKFIRGSVLSPAQLTEAMQGVDGVYHLAGKVERDPRKAHTLYTLHVTGTRNVLEAAAEAQVRRVVVASTSGTVAVTPDGRTIPDDESPHATEVVQRWPYYLSKVYAEKTARSLSERKKLDVILMRPTLLLGPGDARLSSTKDVLNFIEGRIPIVPHGGLSFVDVRDAAVAFRKAMIHGKPNANYLLGAANLTFDAFFERLEKISGVNRPRVAVPDPAARFGAKLLDLTSRFLGHTPDIDPTSVEMSQHFWYLDWSNAMRDLGWTPRDPGQTLYDTVQWLKANKHVWSAAQGSDTDEPAPKTAKEHPFAPDQGWDQQDRWRHAAYSKPEADAWGHKLGEREFTPDPYEIHDGQPVHQDEGPALHEHPANKWMGSSRITYENYGGGPGLDSLVSDSVKDTVKGAATLVGSLVSGIKDAATSRASSTHAPRHAPPRHAPRYEDDEVYPYDAPVHHSDDAAPPSAARHELDDLLKHASAEEMETILRLVRRMKG